VVIAIIAILAAILFPVFARAREKARQTSCLSNVKQIGLAWSMYADDYDEMVMPVQGAATGSKTYYWWASYDGTTVRSDEGLLQPYIHNGQIQACPTFRNAIRTASGNTGYAYNYGYLSPFVPPTWAIVPATLAAIDEASQTVVFADSARLNTWSGAPVVEGNVYLSAPSAEYPTFHARHNGTGNVAWADGHAKAAQPTYRAGSFGWGYNADDFRNAEIGDIDEDGNLTTDELFDLD
jgi:prepilin-type processing-associated H-X9-DG protein